MQCKFLLRNFMSVKFGEIRQIAFIVKDIDLAMNYWSSMLGVGPFFIKRDIFFSDYIYRGQSASSPQVSIALANSGALQIELIAQHDRAPSIYQEFVDKKGEGLQHVSAWLTCEEFDRKRETLLTAGYEIAQECTIPSSGVRLVYFSTEDGPGGFIYEISDLRDEKHYSRVTGIRKSALDWDGSDAIREVRT
jgi:hypothetical protein